MKVAIYTLGCKVNYYESEIIRQAFEEKGFEYVDFGEPCNVAVIHSCAVTGESARKSRQIIRRARRLYPDAVIAAVGCLPQTSQEMLDEADIITGNKNKRNLPLLVMDFIENKKRIIKISDIKNLYEFEDMNLSSDIRTRAVVKIQDGCNNYCSYCVIPYARGPIRSKPLDKAVEEIKNFTDKGYSEIVLTGIHLDNYGKEHNKYDLCDLLEIIDEFDGLKRIRLSSLEPTFITEKNTERLVKLNKLCRHFHLSLQSGSTQTLSRMKRRYTAEEYKQAADLLKKSFPGVSLTTDIIVGFPGESDAEFEESLAFAEKIAFSKIHVFPFSERKGTVAYDMSDKVDSKTKQERCQRMLSLNEKLEKEFYRSFLGKNVDVLFETKKDGVYSGYTDNYAEMHCLIDEDLTNQIKNCLVTQAFADFCVCILK